MAVIFLSFATGHVSFIKMFGIGLTLAVLIDAFLIRGTLVPAFMRLAGEWNWWAPGPLRRFHDRWGISETVDLGDDEAAPVPAVATHPNGQARDPGDVRRAHPAMTPSATSAGRRPRLPKGEGRQLREEILDTDRAPAARDRLGPGRVDPGRGRRRRRHPAVDLPPLRGQDRADLRGRRPPLQGARELRGPGLRGHRRPRRAAWRRWGAPTSSSGSPTPSPTASCS